MRKMYLSHASQALAGNTKQYEVRSGSSRELAKIDRVQDAVNLLNSRRRDARPVTVPEEAQGLQSMPKNSTFTGKPSLSGMKAWLTSLGHSVLPPWDYVV